MDFAQEVFDGNHLDINANEGIISEVVSKFLRIFDLADRGVVDWKYISRSPRIFDLFF